MASQTDKETVRRMIEQAGLITQAEVARRAGVSRQAVSRWIEEGALPCIRIADDTSLVLLSDLEDFMKRRAMKFRTMADIAADSLSKLRSQPHRGRHLED